MKKHIILSLAVLLCAGTVLSACNSGKESKPESSSAVVSVTEQSSAAETTDQPETTEDLYPPVKVDPVPPTTKAEEYTLEELLTKSVPEILGIMDNDITVERNSFDKHFYGGVDGAIIFYNNAKLPGFIFSPNDSYFYSSTVELDDAKERILSGKSDKLSFVVAKNGAKATDELSSDMTYNEVCGVTGIYSINPPAGVGQMHQNITSYFRNADDSFVYYETSREAFMRSVNTGRYDEEFAKQENPKVDYIICFKR